MSAGDGVQSQIDRLRNLAVPVAAAGLAVTLGLSLVPALSRSALSAYLVAFLFWCGLSIGCLALTVLHHLVGGNWGMPIRRFLEIGAVNLIPMALLFLPIVIGMGVLYPWADPRMIEENHLIRFKVEELGYLGQAPFLIRSAIGFTLWIVLALWFYRNSTKRDSVASASPRGIERISGFLMALVFFTGTFAAIDWNMTREPEWYSSIYGPLTLIGWGLEAFAFTILLVTYLTSRSREMAEAATNVRMIDLGNLTLAFTMLWAYMAFSQYLIIWMANMAEEAPWFLRRSHGGWQYVAIALIVLHFFVPFFCLLFRKVKQTPTYMARVAILLLVMHVIDLAWITLPANAQWAESDAVHGIAAFTYAINLIDLGLVLAAFAGIGGAWIFAFTFLLRDRPVVIREALVPAASGGH